MREYELIKNLFSDIKDLFKSDAQIIEINGEKCGITCDDFSLKEETSFSFDSDNVEPKL